MASLAHDTLAHATTVEPLSSNQFRARLSKDWEIWGPNGGYVAAIALRAAGELSEGMLPTSLYCQYLSVAKFDEVTIAVTCIKSGRSTKSLEVAITQQDKPILKALIWLTQSAPGMEHDFTGRPSTWIPCNEAPADDPKWSFSFWKNFEVRQLQPNFTPDRKANNGVSHNWFKYRNEFSLDDPFLNAARSIVLIDTLQWPATVLGYDEGKLDYFAPSLDLNVQFHHNHSQSQWLFCEAKSNTARRGLISGSAGVWDQEGTLLASGGSQLLCMPVKKSS